MLSITYHTHLSNKYMWKRIYKFLNKIKNQGGYHIVRAAVGTHLNNVHGAVNTVSYNVNNSVLIYGYVYVTSFFVECLH